MNPQDSEQKSQHPLRIAIDCREFRPESRGVGVSISRQVAALDAYLARHQSRWRVTLIRHVPAVSLPTNLPQVNAYLDFWNSLKHCHLMDTDASPQSHPAGDWWLNKKLPELLRRKGIDVLYSPAFAAPAAGKTAFARLLMIHDDLIWSTPETYPWKFRKFLEWTMKRSSRAADLVIFPSKDAKFKVSKKLGLSWEKTGALPHSVDSSIFHPVQEKRRNSPRVGVYVAGPEKRKNHEFLFHQLKEIPDFKLVLAGFAERDKARLAALGALAKESKLAWEVFPAKSPPEIARLTRNADVAFFPTLGEGFGLPALEAIACGTPLLAAELPVIREVAGEAGWYLPTDGSRDWGKETVKILEGGSEMERKRQLGLEIAAQFTPEKNAEGLVNFLWRAYSLFTNSKGAS